MYNGWELHRSERIKLLIHIKPVYNDIYPQSLLYQFRSDEALTATTGDVVGSFDNKEGQQVLIFTIDGKTHRPDGRLLHLPWSRDYAIMGRKPFHSKHPLEITDWQPLIPTIAVKLIPRAFDVR